MVVLLILGICICLFLAITVMSEDRNRRAARKAASIVVMLVVVVVAITIAFNVTSDPVTVEEIAEVESNGTDVAHMIALLMK